MTTVTDRRGKSADTNASSRKKFIDRVKDNVRKQVNDAITKRKFKNLKDEKKVKVKRHVFDDEPPMPSSQQGHRKIILTGNDKYRHHDKIDKPRGGKSSGSGSGPDGEDDFEFVLSYDEFMSIYFEDMMLPNFIKESLKKNEKWEIKRKGYSTQGSACRLDLKKTWENSLARKICTRAQGKKPLFLDDSDLKYRFYDKEPKPIRQAVMFLLLDVSGSMTEHHKMLAKKFFILLYLFLTKCYPKVELVFITHTETSEEVDEEEFFNTRRSGGTLIAPAFELVNSIIDSRYPPSEYNIYVSHCSDGDNGWGDDDLQATDALCLKVLPKSQYYTYINVLDANPGYGITPWFRIVKHLSKTYKNIGCATVAEPDMIYPALRGLFER